MTRPHLPPAINIVRFVLHYLVGDVEMLNVYYFRKGDAWSLSEISNCASAISGWEQSYAAPLRAVEVFLHRISCADLTSMDSLLFDYFIEPAIQGASGRNILPGNVTVAVRQVTGERGTGRQGRIFWIGLHQNMIEDGRITIDARNQIESAMLQLEPAVSSTVHCSHVVLHRTRDGATLNPAVGQPVIGWGIADLIPDTQVNRLPGRSRPSHRP